MTCYRLENIQYGTGPYTANNDTSISFTNRHFCDRLRPLPKWEGLTLTSADKFACATLEDLAKWFSDTLDILNSEEYRVLQIEVHSFSGTGNLQVMYREDEVIDKKEINFDLFLELAKTIDNQGYNYAPTNY